MPRSNPLDDCVGFDWDEANTGKKWDRHRVTAEDAEDVFFNEPLIIRNDVRHSKMEQRYYALGQTDAGRLLFVAFTVRGHLIRVISAREINRNQKSIYAEKD